MRASISEFFEDLRSSKLLKSGVIVFFFVFAGRGIQFLKELFVAKEIGASTDLDAFIIALLVNNIFLNFLFASLGYALIPIFIRIKNYSLQKANLFFNKIVLFSLFLGGLGYLLIALFSQLYIPYVAGGFSEETKALSEGMIYLLAPFYFFTILNGLFGAYLNAFNKNLLYSIYPAFPAFFTVLLFLLVPHDQPIWLQVYGFNIGSLIAFVALWISCRQSGYEWSITFNLDKSFRICLNQWIPLIFSALILSISPMVDTKMASDLGASSVSHLEYGSKLFSIFTSLAITVFTILLYPYFSEKIAEKDFSGILSFLKKSTALLLVPLIVGTAGVIYFSSELIQLLFERGEFEAHDTAIVSEVMDYYMVGFPILALGMIGVRLLNALQFNKLIMYYSIVNVVLNIVLNIWFIDLFGLKGVALSTSFVYFVNALLVWSSVAWFFRNKMKKGLI